MNLRREVADKASREELYSAVRTEMQSVEERLAVRDQALSLVYLIGHVFRTVYCDHMSVFVIFCIFGTVFNSTFRRQWTQQHRRRASARLTTS